MVKPLGFDQKIQMGMEIHKNQKNEKPKDITLLCHIYIVSIQVDKQGLDIFKPENHVYIYP